jgi:tRNA threonylcarbamoyladenosine biosynthesis protein TsaE
MMSAPPGAEAGSRAGAPRRHEEVTTVQVQVAGATQMRRLGTRLAGLLRAGDLVVLTGPLGAGKTTLVQGIGAGLDVRGPVTSPTFVIARVHPSLRGGPDLVHADAYRLGSRIEVDDLDLDADVEHAVTVVEWGEGLVEDLTAGHLRITIGFEEPGQADSQAGTQADGQQDAQGDEPRLVTMSGHGGRWPAVAGELSEALAAQERGADGEK